MSDNPVIYNNPAKTADVVERASAIARNSSVGRDWHEGERFFFPDVLPLSYHVTYQPLFADEQKTFVSLFRDRISKNLDHPNSSKKIETNELGFSNKLARAYVKYTRRFQPKEDAEKFLPPLFHGSGCLESLTTIYQIWCKCVLPVLLSGLASVFSFCCSDTCVENTFALSDKRNLSLHDLLWLEKWQLFLGLLGRLLPLWIVSVAALISFGNGTLSYDSCQAGHNSTIGVNPIAYNQTCNFQIPLAASSLSGAVSLNGQTINAHSPALHAYDGSSAYGNCLGISFKVSAQNNDKQLSWPLYVQYFLYAYAGVLLPFMLYNLETKEHAYINLAVYMGGVYQEDKSFKGNASSESLSKLAGSLYAYAKDSPYLLPISFLLTGVMYLLTLILAPTVITQDWYIFPFLASLQKTTPLAATSGRSWAVVQEQSFMRGKQFIGAAYCDILHRPLHITYKTNLSNTNISASILQMFILISTLWGAYSSQQKIYSFMDPDTYMDSQNKETCAYYHLHFNRDKVISNIMLNDWIFVNLLCAFAESLIDGEVDDMRVNKEEDRADLSKLLRDVFEKAAKETADMEANVEKELAEQPVDERLSRSSKFLQHKPPNKSALASSVRIQPHNVDNL